MKDLNGITTLPDVKGAVLSDSSGALIDWSGNVDGEVAGAVHSFAVQALTGAGDLLGLGSLQHMSISGRGSASVIAQRGDAVVGIYVDPAKPLAAIEKKLIEALNK